jgi:hypothetical protein
MELVLIVGVDIVVDIVDTADGTSVAAALTSDNSTEYPLFYSVSLT